MKKFLFTIAILMFFVIASTSVQATPPNYYNDGEMSRPNFRDEGRDVCINDGGNIVDITNGNRICPTGKPCDWYTGEGTRKCEVKKPIDVPDYYLRFNQ